MQIKEIHRLAVVITTAVTLLFVAAASQPHMSIAAGTTFIVDSKQDEPDGNPGDGVCATSQNKCTFRAALDESNALPGPNQIHFNILNDGNCPSSATTIYGYSSNFNYGGGYVGSYVITDDGLTIDGYTQCQASPNSNEIDGNADIRIQITNGSGGSAYGLVINSDNNLIRGLSIYGWERNVEIREASYNRFSGNFVGMKANGADGNGKTGIRINFGASYNIIGGTDLADRNIISGNGFEGLDIQGDDVVYNHIINNYIGVKQDGKTHLKNEADAVDLAERAAYNWVGGIMLDAVGQPILDENGRTIADPKKRNIIAGNSQDGIEISHKLETQYNHFVGNWIGLDAYGNPLGNGDNGVTFEDQVNNNYVYQNIIVDSAANGVRFYTVYDNYVYDNWIGVLPDGTPMPNGVGNSTKGSSGVYLMGGSTGNQIFRNTIAYNKEYGIYINTEPGYLADPKRGGYGNCDTEENTFSQNSTFDNVKQGIRLKNGGCSIDSKIHYPNDGIHPPEILVANTAGVQGTTDDCIGCTVEIFLVAPNDTQDYSHGEGITFISSTISDALGNFYVLISGANAGDKITATITDLNGNTSEYAANFVVAEGDQAPHPTSTPTNTPTITPTPSETPTPSITPTPSETPTESPTATATETALPTLTPTNTAEPEATHTPLPTSTGTITATPIGSSVTATPSATATSPGNSPLTPTPDNGGPLASPTPENILPQIYLPFVSR